MNKKIVLLLFLILFLISVLPVNAFVVCPGVQYIVTNGADPDEFYETDRCVSFNNLTLDTNWVSFNALGFNITSDDQVFINISQINTEPKHPFGTPYIISFNASASLGTIVHFRIGGLVSSHTYNLINSSTTESIRSNASGTVRFNRSNWVVGTHPYVIEDNSTIPVVQTNATTGVNMTNATIRGYISNQGGSNVTEYGFNYGQTSSMTTTVERGTNYFEHNPSSNHYYTLSNNVWCAQGFRVAYNGTNVSHIVTGIKLYFVRDGGIDPGTITVRLYAANASWGPSGPVLASGSIDGNIIKTVTLVTKTINFTSPYTVIEGGRYVWAVGAANPGLNYLSLNYRASSIYPSIRYLSLDNGTTYHNFSGPPGIPTNDFSFEVVGYEESFSENLTGLSVATRYFDRAFANNSYGTGTGSMLQFLTEPQAPTLFTATPALGVIDLDWTNPAIGAGVNRSVVIRYRNDSYPTSLGDGTLLTNESSPLDTDSYSVAFTGTVYFSIWTYVNCSTMHRFSPLHASASASSGGTFNISVFYENWTQGFVNLSRFGPHKLIVYGSNSTKEINFQSDQTWGDLRLNLSRGSINHQLQHGYLAFNLSFNPYQIELRWNNSDTLSRRCNRMITYEGDHNMTFYIFIDKFYYDGLYVTDFNESLVKWTYNFIDNTGIFINRPGVDTYAYIYTFNPNGTRMVIHSEYLDSYKKMYPNLLYGKKYYIGISCSVSTIDKIGFAPTETDTSRTTSLYVVIDINTTTVLPEYTIHADYSAGGAGLYVYYSDGLLSVVSSWVRVYDYTNGSLMYSSSSTASVKNYTFPGALHNRSYTIYLVINSSDSNLNYVFEFFLTPGVSARWSYSTINSTLTTMFGYTPFRSYESPSGKAIVPWADILVFVIFCFILFSISGFNAALAGLASGGWFVFAGAMISGSPAIFVTLGAIILIMSFLFAWGDRN